MKAMVVTQHGPPEVLTMQEIAEPAPGEHDLLVEVRAAALNPVDCTMRRTGMKVNPKPPFVAGYDVSGVVRAVGPAVQGFKMGDEVYASPSMARNGSDAELVCVDARSAAHKPRSLSHLEAAAMPLVTLTAWEALHDRAKTRTGDTVLIHAGGGGVGHIAIQMAKLHGCRVITTASQDDSIALCRQVGADVIINYKSQNFVQKVKEETHGKGCAVVFDCVGGEVFDQSLDCVGVNGHIVTILAPKSERMPKVLFFQNASAHWVLMAAPTVYGINPQYQGDILRKAAALVDAGKLKPHIGRVIDLEQLPEGHRQMETGHTVGKIVIRVKGK